MGSSISHENIETTSAVRTEAVTGAHNFKVYGYSLTRGIGLGYYINSDVFKIGEYDWVIQYYRDGNRDESNDADVKARFTVTILEQNGSPSAMTWTSGVLTFSSNTTSASWGNSKLTKITEFEASKCLKDDAFTVKYPVTVVKGTKLDAINSPCGVTIPPPVLNQNLADLLKTGKGADVTFVVEGERFNAHRCVLAARSVVFQAEFFGGMKENWTNTIKINDIEAPVFKSMLYFVYPDSVPDFDGTTDDDDEKHDLSMMAQYLLVAADRYALERLKSICEDLLCKNLSVRNTMSTLILAERYNCSELKEQCFKFMSSAEVFKEVAPTDEFDNMCKIYPSLLKDIKALCLK